MPNSKSHQLNVLLAISHLKMFSEQSTFLLGEISQKKKRYHFEKAVKETDKFLKLIENDLSEHSKATLDELIISLNDGMQGLRNDIMSNNN